MQTSVTSPTTSTESSQYKGVLHCELYDYGECSGETVDAPFSKFFCHVKLEILTRFDGFVL